MTPTLYDGDMDARPPLVMTFASLDEAESALDWIGVAFVDADSAFEGTLLDDDRDLLAAAIADADTPEPVRDLARALGRLLETAGGERGCLWRVDFEV
jgi:hypothetical protein